MLRNRGMTAGMLGAALLAGGCLGNSAAVGTGAPQHSEDVLSGGRFREPWLSKAIRDAEGEPLGSKENPVRADMPAGQRAYLARLRCTNGEPPTWTRIGNLGPGAFGSIVDQYDVRCDGSAPRRTIVVMDMYFKGHVETRAIDGFTIAPP